jgi:hypothetical protein
MIGSRRRGMVRKRLQIVLALGVVLALSMLVVSGCSGGSGATVPGQGTGPALPQASTPLPASASWIATGDGPDRHFGFTVANVGDVNADGRADVIVCDDRYKQFVGRVYVYAGGPTGLSTGPIWIATGESADSSFGRSVAGVGDVNGDGYSDVVVGAPDYDNSTGRVYFYAGGPGGLRADPMMILTGEKRQDDFGWALGGAGDINGDGYDDVIVGADRFNNLTGRAYIYLGGPHGLSATAALTFTGEGPNNFFGHAVAGTGDVNADGYDDFLCSRISAHFGSK